MKTIRGGLNGAVKIETLNPFVLRLNLWDFETNGSINCILKDNAIEYWHQIRTSALPLGTIIYGDYDASGQFIAQSYSFALANPFPAHAVNRHKHLDIETSRFSFLH